MPSQVIYNAIFATEYDGTQLQDGHVSCLFRATNFTAVSLPFEHCVFRECCVTVAVVTSWTRNSTETVLLRPRNVSVKIPVQNVATATVTLQSRWTQGIRNVQIELKSAVNTHQWRMRGIAHALRKLYSIDLQ